MKQTYSIFNVKETKSYIDLKLLIIDFDNRRNCDLFISNFCKFLIVNKFEKDKEISFVNFSSTYDKSLRLQRNVTGQLFELSF